MRSHVAIASIVGLSVGLAGGAATTWFWLQRGHDLRDDGHEAAHAETAAHAGETHGEVGHEEHTEGRVKLSEEAIREFGIETSVAGVGRLAGTLSVPGEIVLNADRAAHVVPRVSGMVREVRKNVGDAVTQGEIMAVMESRELAEARAADLSAESRLKLAEANFKRVEDLVSQKIAPEKDYHEVKQKLAEAQIQHRETEAKLHALGLDHAQVSATGAAGGSEFSRYDITAPFAGTVVEKHIALGEVHDSGSDVFMVADLSTVWVDITIYPQDAARVRQGSRVLLSAPGPDGRALKTEGTIFYVSPVIRESTRTGMARALITNDQHAWKPGLFVTVDIVLEEQQAAVVVPNDGIQTMERQSVVFVAEGDGFEKRVVTVGRSSATSSEITAGLKAGERFVSKGAFILKAELAKGEGGHEH